ncbi:MAG TPA: ABC transporter permease [Bauldia sp.]
MTDATVKGRPRRWSMDRINMAAVAPFVALVVLLIAGTFVNENFFSVNNLINVLTRAAFTAIIGVGATFVISAGGLDLSVGSMTAFVASLMIMFLNTGAVADPFWMLIAGVALAIVLGAACGLANGLIVTVGRIEPFIATLGTMGVLRGLTTWLSQGGSMTLRAADIETIYHPIYFGKVLGVPVPIIFIAVTAIVGAFVLYRTAYGRHVVAVGSSEDVARYSGIAVGRVRTVTYIIQGVCVGIAVLLYVPRLSASNATTGLLWELQAITAVVVGGTALRGGIGRVWGTICGAFILEIVGNIMLLSNFISEYLIGAVQGAIIIIAMLVQRSLMRRT